MIIEALFYIDDLMAPILEEEGRTLGRLSMKSLKYFYFWISSLIILYLEKSDNIKGDGNIQNLSQYTDNWSSEVPSTPNTDEINENSFRKPSIIHKVWLWFLNFCKKLHDYKIILNRLKIVRRLIGKYQDYSQFGLYSVH